MKKYKSKIKEFEENLRFDEHVKQINPMFIKPLPKNYKYVSKNIFFVCYSAIVRGILKIVTPIFNAIVHKVKTEGKNNLKGLNKGIVTSNHVLVTDNLLARQAIKKKLYVAAAGFNNKKGFAGLTLKAGGLIPLWDNLSTRKKFDEAIELLLKKNNFILFYPEQSMWPKYEKPRPLKRGAFLYAVRNNVPIVPIFLCFRDKSSRYKKSKFTKVTIKILPPVFANTDLDERERIENLKVRTEEAYKSAYEEFYGKPLVFENHKTQNN